MADEPTRVIRQPAIAPATDGEPSPAELQADNERLRARVAALEAELVEVQARANAAVAEWEDRAYWLDRLHIDLNALMQKPGANEARIVLKAVRALYWGLKRALRRLREP